MDPDQQAQLTPKAGQVLVGADKDFLCQVLSFKLAYPPGQVAGNFLAESTGLFSRTYLP